MKSIKQLSASGIAMSNKEISRRLTYLLGVHVVLWMAVMTFALNVEQALLIA